MSAPDVDLLVTGGGPAGCATAIAAARLGLRVALVHDGRQRSRRAGESLPPSVRPLLEGLGVLEEVAAGPHLPSYANHAYWGGGGETVYDFLNEPYGPGLQIDRAALDETLLRAVRQAGAALYDGAGLGALRRDERGGWLATARGRDGDLLLRAAIVVDAGGRARPVARALGARFRPVDRLVAAVWHFPAPERQPRPTLVEATADGWWYSASLPGRRLIAIYFTDPDLLRQRAVRSAPEMRTLLAEAPATAARFEVCAADGGPARIVSAAGGCLDRAAGDGWLAAGDAAATYDPISSHGVGAALDAGIAAAAAARGAVAGDADALAAYDRRVRHGFALYLRRWHAVYRMEERWLDAPFWRRRHRAASPVADDGPADAGPDRYNQRDGAAASEVQR